MSADRFAADHLFSRGQPGPGERFAGFPRFNFVGGHNAPELVPVAELAACAQKVVSEHGQLLALYNLSHGPQGFRGLRALVADKLTRHRGIACDADDVLVTSGSTQGLELVFQAFVEPGDSVVVEEFTYGSVLPRLKKLGAEVIGGPLDDDGLDTEALAIILAERKAAGRPVKLVYTIPTIQNPTGTILPLERRRRLIELADEYDFVIFEDECYADLVWALDAPPALYGMAPGRVVHIGSFSKTLAPALRVGYAVGRWPVLGRLVAAKNDAGSGAVDQMIVAEYFGRHFDAHVGKLTRGLKAKLDAMIEAVDASFGTAAEYRVPKGGIFLWLKLPDTVDVRKLVAPAAKAGILFNPGPEWATDGEAAKSMLRLCFAMPSVETIREGVAAFARVCYEETGIPLSDRNTPMAPR